MINERIKELADQAGVSITAADKNGVFTLLPDKQKKFAELIVDEVYDYILNATFDDEPWPDRKDVRKHFGVEE
jgi:hypothetical protein